jgi:hypothetical protein
MNRVSIELPVLAENPLEGPQLKLPRLGDASELDDCEYISVSTSAIPAGAGRLC